MTISVGILQTAAASIMKAFRSHQLLGQDLAAAICAASSRAALSNPALTMKVTGWGITNKSEHPGGVKPFFFVFLRVRGAVIGWKLTELALCCPPAGICQFCEHLESWNRELVFFRSKLTHFEQTPPSFVFCRIIGLHYWVHNIRNIFVDPVWRP